MTLTVMWGSTQKWYKYPQHIAGEGKKKMTLSVMWGSTQKWYKYHQYIAGEGCEPVWPSGKALGW